MSSLSAYPDEKEYLFFFAEIPIRALYVGDGEKKRFDMGPLSLYQSIIHGEIMIDKFLLGKAKKKKGKGNH